MPYSFTKMMTINEPHLIERYNRALLSFGYEAVELDSFQIDMMGFSPEVADYLGNQDYLDEKKVNRRFIVLSPEQANLSVVHTSFSNTRDLMLEFFERNKRVLFALTIKDVVFGEIEDSIFEVDDIDDLLSIEQVEFKIQTHENLTDKTNELKMMIDRLLKEPDAWRDNEMLNQMVEFSKQTGDIRNNELVPEEVLFRHETFWAAHFGGIFILNDDPNITVICDPSASGFRKSRPWQVAYIDIHDQKSVYNFLLNSGRLQPPFGSWIERSRLLELRRHMAAAWLAEQKHEEMPPSIINQTWVSRFIRENRDLVRNDNTIPLIDWTFEQVEDWEHIDVDEVEDDMRFVLARANPAHDDHRLVNKLIAQYLPFDFITKFEFNRPNFIKSRQEWSDNYSEFVAKEISNTYLNNNKALYEDLYL